MTSIGSMKKRPATDCRGQSKRVDQPDYVVGKNESESSIGLLAHAARDVSASARARGDQSDVIIEPPPNPQMCTALSVGLKSNRNGPRPSPDTEAALRLTPSDLSAFCEALTKGCSHAVALNTCGQTWRAINRRLQIDISFFQRYAQALAIAQKTRWERKAEKYQRRARKRQQLFRTNQ